MTKSFTDLTPQEQFNTIEKMLQEEVYPMLESDAGGMELLTVEGFTVRVRYQGACDGCAVAYTGTGEFIEQLLKMQIDPQIRLIIEQ